MLGLLDGWDLKYSPYACAVSAFNFCVISLALKVDYFFNHLIENKNTEKNVTY